MYEGCSKNNVTCGGFRGKREQWVKKKLVRRVECLLNFNISKICAYRYTDLRPVNIIL